MGQCRLPTRLGLPEKVTRICQRGSEHGIGFLPKASMGSSQGNSHYLYLAIGVLAPGEVAHGLRSPRIAIYKGPFRLATGTAPEGVGERALLPLPIPPECLR